MELQITRRDFFKGSIVVAMGAAGAASLSACAPKGSASKDEPKSDAKVDEGAKTATLRRGYGAAHGDRCFTSVVVATADDGTILAASVDEYQFMGADTEGITPVPNSDAGFGEGCAEGKVLMSKVTNNDMYSAMIAEKAQSKQKWVTSMEAIQEYAVGKKPADLANAGFDAVSGATLVDTPNYLKLIGEVAEMKDLTTTGTYTGDGSDLKMGRVITVAHGDRTFAEAVALVQGDVLVAASIDEFQFMGADSEGIIPVPNSDAGLGEGCAEGMVLMSKSVSSDMYSNMMKEKAQATVPWVESMAAIEAFVAGQKVSEVAAKGPDAVSGATLVDTVAYVEAAKKAAQAV